MVQRSDARRGAHRRRGAGPRAGRTDPGAGDVVVVDVGGATTDVHSVVEVDPDRHADGLSREVVATTPVTRTVEGDLGMRWSAVSTVAEAGSRRALRGGRAPPATTRRTSRTPTPRPTSTRRSPGRPSASPCVGTRVAAVWWSAPRAAWSSAPARTCARSTCSSARAGCCATGGPAWPTGCWPAAPEPTSTAAGSCREHPVSSSTPTTPWPRSGCWPRSIPEAAYALSTTLWGASAMRPDH